MSAVEIDTAKRVVINADDLGLHPAVNRGIVRAHRDGIVSSASLIACGRGFEDAADRLRANPGLGIGVHLTLVEEAPVSKASDVPSLVGADGCMPRTYRQFAARWLLGRINPKHVRRELRAQLNRVVAAGLRPTHLDSHQHVHCLPWIWPMVMELADRYDVPFVRVPRFDAVVNGATGCADVALRLAVNGLALLRQSRWASSVRRADALRGASRSGRMTSHALQQIISDLDAGTTEIMVHPGERDEDLQRCYGHWRGFDWATELEAVTDARVRLTCVRHGARLCRFERDGI